MSGKSAHAFWITGPESSEIRAETIADPLDGEVAIQTLYSAISRGTESLVSVSYTHLTLPTIYSV